MKAFITGITGFVGSHLADYLLEQNVEVYGLTRWRSPKENIRHCLDKIDLVHGDLLDVPSMHRAISKIRPNFIFHLAAQSYVPYSFDAPSSTLDTNCIGTCNLLEVVRMLRESDGYDPIIHICSSSECYGQVQTNETPITEENPFRPASPYAVSKVCEDMLGFQYWLSYGLKTIRTRLFTHTGPRRGDVFVVSTFAKQIAGIETSNKEPVIKVGNLDSVRTFMDVRDAVKAYWLLVNKCPPGEVYNIGGNVTMTVGEMLQCLLRLSAWASEIRIEVDKDRLRPSDVTMQIPSSAKFKDATGWEPEIHFDTTLNDTLNYWRHWWRNQ